MVLQVREDSAGMFNHTVSHSIISHSITLSDTVSHSLLYNITQYYNLRPKINTWSHIAKFGALRGLKRVFKLNTHSGLRTRTEQRFGTKAALFRAFHGSFTLSRFEKYKIVIFWLTYTLCHSLFVLVFFRRGGVCLIYNIHYVVKKIL